MRHILIIDNHVAQPCHACYAFREHIEANYRVVVRAKDDLPKKLDSYSHIVLTGGIGRLDLADESFKQLKNLVSQAQKDSIPLLGICFGHQAIVAALSSDDHINHYRRPTTGWVKIHRLGKSRLLRGLPSKFYAFEHHHDDVNRLPAGFVQTATSRRNSIEAFEHKELPIFGVQFHPEINRRRSARIVAQQISERLPGDWLVRHDVGRTPFSELPSKIIFANFYKFKKPE